ncbi:NADH:ubiquinone reductase (Na(+)-transporting) subunit D [Agrobacterium tumefaciens]|uniref:NADH:ubiquinone reductase (Na(+)-transporting) subunit D n=1 Tax=Brucella anthropi TaxID=529 RepID=A0A6I0CSB5_BRUAN|nr:MULTISPECIES: NADH:ubiquinone reductase (Na(+)-transporting) subunit D [Hyphomicrobiales]MCQ9147151.1 NADH:ubiquinone reductase (Na(+)-transporting) subunit D [Ochrobactrum sp. BTU2]MDX3928137.1 NADH:ubiquinone reductase (Na(+)-transporting) subunit D [Shinella sp.]WKL22116.1 NADH:ubiquinone reductase (Na(+)-transporting) subunit D [Agrobacterium tumefaciens]HBT70525.1 NADH:ubiquinone reductase (Na(+)-transporting) subunit D [Agrobacterium sp.]KAB2758318.1 NADH:ubiquinone reductase (Na(+)-t
MTIAFRNLTDPLVDKNPVTVHILGICSALAVTTSMSTALTMSIALTVVLGLSAGIISAIRRHIPSSVRIILQITIIASLVIVADQFLQAFAYEMSQRLTVFVSLIATNCIVLGRTEAYALHNPVLPSMVDGVGNGLGYSLVLLTVAAIRELFGSGSLFGIGVLPLVADGGWYQPLRLMLLAPSAFIILGLLVWAVRSLRPAQTEAPEFELREQERAAET